MGMDMATGGKGTSGDINLSTRSSSYRPSEWKTRRAFKLLQRHWAIRDDQPGNCVWPSLLVLTFPGWSYLSVVFLVVMTILERDKTTSKLSSLPIYKVSDGVSPLDTKQLAFGSRFLASLVEYDTVLGKTSVDLTEDSNFFQRTVCWDGWSSSCWLSANLNL